MATSSPLVPLEDLLGGGGLVVLAPHPDDESLGCGGLIAAAHARGRKVHVVLATDGSASHRRSNRYPTAALAALRWQEFQAAMDTLAPGSTSRALGLRDSAAPTDPHQLAKLLPALAEDVRATEADRIFVTWEGDPHHDHQVCARLATMLRRQHAGLKMISYPIWGRFTTTLAKPLAAGRLRRFATKAYLDVKRRAVACHRSQMTSLIDDDPTGFVMAAETQAHFVEDPEIFIV